jgi:hypothetical protein
MEEERLHCVLPRWLGGGLIALGVLQMRWTIAAVVHG